MTVLPDVTVTLHADTSRATEALTRAFAQLGEAIARAATALTPLARVMAEAGVHRWRTDVPPHRWRDWLPSGERPVDRARRQRLDTAMRARARRAARHRRVLR